MDLSKYFEKVKDSMKGEMNNEFFDVDKLLEALHDAPVITDYILKNIDKINDGGKIDILVSKEDTQVEIDGNKAVIILGFIHLCRAIITKTEGKLSKEFLIALLLNIYDGDLK